MSEYQRLYDLINQKTRLYDGRVMGIVQCHYDKLATHLLDNGVRALPCQIGDEVFCIRYDRKRKPFVKKLIVHTITICSNDKYAVFTTKEDWWNQTVFATEEEAEQKIMERMVAIGA